jgi:ABC-type nitrate/sulfonate/bicarbonate transport system permease component
VAKISRTAQERIITTASPIAVLVLWQVLSSTGALDVRYVPSPVSIAAKGWTLVQSGELWQHISVTLYRLVLGFLIGSIPGIFIGMLMGLSWMFRAAVDPIVSATYPIPKIAVLPLLMLVFGIGDASKVAVVAISVVYLTIINTMTGVMSIDRTYFDVARNFKTPRAKLFLRLILPGSLPMIFAGLRISLGVAMIVVVGAEFVSSNAGIGYLIWSSWETLSVESMFVGIIVITILGLLSNVALREIERLCMPWRTES